MRSTQVRSTDPGDGSREEAVRVIDVGAPPTRFARGWHCLGLIRDFADGKPHQVSAFGTELVVFAGEDGKVNVLDAYCRHMGGNLARGQVKGNTIACPFHDWRWRGDGKCVEIPYARRVPPVAKTKAWTTSVVSGQLFIWHDPEGTKTPPPELAIPEIPVHGDPGWTDWVWNSIDVQGAHCREIVDNIVDMAHFFYVHYGMPTYFRNVFEGHTATQVMRSLPRADATDVSMNRTNYSAESRSDASYFGPSYMIDKLWTGGTDPDAEPNVYLINCHYPISPTSFRLHYGVMAAKPEGVPDEQAQQIAEAIAKGVAIGFEQDVEIWKYKSRIDNPLLSEEDGPVYQLRRWYEQFYVDVADVQPEMVDRFEFEIDTERALTNWQAEIDANLAAGRTAFDPVGGSAS